MAQSETAWTSGDIAFLKNIDDLTKADKDIVSKYIPVKATGHPVIILESSTNSKYCLVTTVSAYNSDARNKFLAPWKQPFHKDKSRNAFFAFAGSEKPANWQQHLELENGRWPKPKTSWVYSRYSYIVPCSALREFRRETRLRMTPGSLQYLLTAMAKNDPPATRWNDSRLPWDARACAPKRAGQKAFLSTAPPPPPPTNNPWTRVERKPWSGPPRQQVVPPLKG